MKKQTKAGGLIIIADLYWIYDHLQLYYEYHYTSLLHLFQLPDWVLFLNVILGIIGIFIGIAVIRNKMAIKRANLINFGGLLIGFLFEYLIIIF